MFNIYFNKISFRFDIYFKKISFRFNIFCFELF